jgi:hypothetical protein
MGKGKKKRRVGCSVSAAAIIRRRRLIGVECAGARARRQLDGADGLACRSPLDRCMGQQSLPQHEGAAEGEEEDIADCWHNTGSG